MKSKGDDFANHLTELNNLNNDAREKVDKLLKEMNSKKPKNTCDVCYSRLKTHATVPCYHTYCENCASRALSRNRCFQCRGRIDNIVRIFI